MDKDKTIRNVPFSGKKDEFTIWSQCFLAYAHLTNCKKVITEVDNVPAATEVYNPTTDVNKLAARKANSTAYSMLTMAATDSVSFGAVFNAQTTDLPDGDSHQARLNLEMIFKPKSFAKRHELEQSFNSCAL
jgi:hypothetical protein